mmetsp:Transcript_18084/g.54070  ORF Transcript_18084/g.54070 Transcript_18084/m.54070 type:complete len:147 (+) Transcript_18084:909-1349(+)
MLAATKKFSSAAATCICRCNINSLWDSSMLLTTCPSVTSSSPARLEAPAAAAAQTQRRDVTSARIALDVNGASAPPQHVCAAAATECLATPGSSAPTVRALACVRRNSAVAQRPLPRMVRRWTPLLHGMRSLWGTSQRTYRPIDGG